MPGTAPKPYRPIGGGAALPPAERRPACPAARRGRGLPARVCFGDGENDLSLFAAADEGYAVANAVDNLKRAATAVIGSNDEDGVARWLLEHAI